jgi:DNA-binding protein H-NS
MKKITRQIRLTHQTQDSYHENLITKKKININKLNKKKLHKKLKRKNKRKKQLYNIIQYNNNYYYN